jgi:flavodoxin
MKCLVVFYSKSGHTAKVGRALAEALGADVQEIRSRRKYRGPWGFMAGAYQAARGKTPRLEKISHDPEGYDVVVIGTPVWAGTMAPPVRSFLHVHGEKIRNAAFFLTAGGENPGRAFQDMEKLSGCTPLATLATRAGEVKKSTSEKIAQRVEGMVTAVKGV